MSSQPAALTVCIPAHNEEQTIAITLESVLNQTWNSAPEMEVLVGANACTDGTHSEVKRVQEAHPGSIRLLDIKERGKPNAWNVLRQEASHDNLIFIDGDVQVDTRAISELLQMLEMRGDLVVVQGMNAAVLRECSWLTRLSRPRPNMDNGILMKAWQDTLCGRLYGVKKSKLEPIMADFGFGTMPEDLIHDDGWLRCLLDMAASRQRQVPLERVIRGESRYWEVCPNAHVYFLPPEWGEDVKIQVRTLHARDQLNRMFPEYAAAIERLKAGNKARGRFRERRRLIEQMRGDNPLRYSIRRFLQHLTKRKVQRIYAENKASGETMSARTFARSETSKRAFDSAATSAL